MARKHSKLGGWCFANALLVAALAAHLLFQALPSTEAVRLRNALVMEPQAASSFGWIPQRHPPGFRLETLAPDPRFVAVVHAIGADRGSDFSRMLILAGHLTENAREGGPIQANNWTTYKRIREGAGYCADFTQTFLALAHAAGLTAREWGFSFDGFGGWGHAVVEVFDRQRERWIFLDVFNNFHVVDRGNGEPLDVPAWRQAIPEGDRQVRIVHNGPGRFGWPQDESGLWDYYRRGLNGWYLWLGNDVQTYDSQPLVSLAGQVSRSLEQFVAILTGVHPHLQVLGSEHNQAALERMLKLRQQLLVELPLLGLTLLSLVGLCFLWRRAIGTAAIPPLVQADISPRVLLVGPLPPPSGGMAGQCGQLAQLLRADGVEVDLVQTNAPFQPAWTGRVRGLRALCRLLPYLWRLWKHLPGCDVAHVFANSGWAWHLQAAPAIVLAHLRQVPVIVNYHGGEAERFFASAPVLTCHVLGLADALVVPSGYLEDVFRRLGYASRVLPNGVDLTRFRPREQTKPSAFPHILVTRNLETVYDIPTALQAFAIIAKHFPEARMTVAGSGPEAEMLQHLAEEMGLSEQISFPGRIDNREIHTLYAQADLLLNPSTADNMPVSLIEALACAVPVVSTRVGGIPYLVQDGGNGLLVPPRDPRAMADAALAILNDALLAAHLAANGLGTVATFAWPQVCRQWLELYDWLISGKAQACHA